MRISDWSSDVCSSDLEGLALWQRFLDSGGLLRDHPEPPPSDSPAAARDRRFADPAWTEHPFYDLIRQSYLLLSDYLMKLADAVDGVEPKQKAKLRFATTDRQSRGEGWGAARRGIMGGRGDVQEKQHNT